MKPTVQAPEFYQVGNDYVQAPLDKFYSSAFSGIGPDGKPYVDDSYRDGIYRQLSDELVNGAYSADPFKDPSGFNKRTVLVEPFAPIPTYTSGSDTTDYSVADVVYGIGPDDKAGSAVNPNKKKFDA